MTSDAAPRKKTWLAPGIRFMVASAFFFTIMTTIVKVLGERLPSDEIVLARATAMLLLSYAALRHAKVSPWGANQRLLIGRGIAGFGGLYCYYYAVTHLPLADATVIQFTNPAFTVLLAAWMLQEQPSFRQIAGASLSLIGVLFVARPSFLFGGGSLDVWAVVVGLVGAFCSAIAYVTIRQLRATDDPMVIVFWFSLVAVPLAVGPALTSLVWPTPLEWLLLALLGATTQIAQVFMTRGLHLEPAGRATAITYLQVVFSYGFGIVLFAETPTTAGMLGSALVVAGTLPAALAPSKRR